MYFLIIDFEKKKKSQPIPFSLYFKELTYPVSVFTTSLITTLNFNLSDQLLLLFVLKLPNQSRSLNINGAYFNILFFCMYILKIN